jgi:hypothetical protein
MVRVGNREQLWQAFETLEGGTPPAELESLSDADALRLLFGLYHESAPPSVSPALVRRYPPRPALYLPADSF